jgi:transposase
LRGSGGYNRAALKGMLWIVRTGTPWRDLDERFAKWSSVWNPSSLFLYNWRSY